MITAQEFVAQALVGNYLGIAYEKLDCQAFVEKVLHDCGISQNWRGSNHMWREALSYKKAIESVSEIPAGAWLFTVKQDGGEKERGYNDNEGNAKHVGIYLGNNDVIHSTTGGVQMDKITSKRWTHYGLCKYIDYNNVPASENTPASVKEIFEYLGTLSLHDFIQYVRKYMG